jgi:hypothetical protein
MSTSAYNHREIAARMTALFPDGIWWDDAGCWVQIDGRTYGPFATEKEAESYEP